LAGRPGASALGLPCPSDAPGDESDKCVAFELTRQALSYRMLLLLQLPLETMDDAALKKAMLDIALQ
jgi:arsenate reductase